MTDNDLRALWHAAGGYFHGPHVESGTMPEDKLLAFLRGLIEAEPIIPSKGWKPKLTPAKLRALAHLNRPEDGFDIECRGAILTSCHALELMGLVKQGDTYDRYSITQAGRIALLLTLIGSCRSRSSCIPDPKSCASPTL